MMFEKNEYQISTGNKIKLNQSKKFDINICFLLNLLTNTAIKKIKFTKIAIKPSITMVPSTTGKGIAALLLPCALLVSSTTRIIADTIKQILQMKAILENVRIRKITSIQ